MSKNTIQVRLQMIVSECEADGRAKKNGISKMLFKNERWIIPPQLGAFIKLPLPSEKSVCYPTINTMTVENGEHIICALQTYGVPPNISIRDILDDMLAYGFSVHAFDLKTGECIDKPEQSPEHQHQSSEEILIEELRKCHGKFGEIGLDLWQDGIETALLRVGAKP